MRTEHRNTLIIAVACVALTASADGASAETCGNGIDDDADGYADEGCGFANWVMGVCESPMSCAETGDIDPVTGAWVYQLPADIAPTVPFGPRFEFKRTYMSKYSPPAEDYRTAMGDRWQHNFQAWLDKSGTSVVVHMPTGQEVKFTYSSTPGDGFDYYNAAQPGAHFKHLRQAVASPNHWELKTLTGEVLKFSWASPVGKLVEIHDSLATPNKIEIDYFTGGGNRGQIDTVTDATGKKRFKFSYSQGRVSSVAYQTGSNSWTTRVTLAFGYTSANPTTVQIGGTTIQTNTYTSGFLTNIADGDGKTIVNVNYSAATPGKVANVTTANGSLAYDYASSHAQCSGNTALFFNLANATACDLDSDCGSGLRCGGKTGSGTTGKCYRAARCLTTTSPSENLVTTVTPFSPCTGACAPTSQYSWNTTTLDLKGIKLADNNWTSFERDANGMVKTLVEGDVDDIAANTGGAKTWFWYDPSFPGRVTEARRRSDTPRGSACDATTTTDCKQTLYTWNSDGLLATTEERGYTGDGDIAYTYITTNSFDALGRLTLVDGPLAGSNDATEFVFWTSADVHKDGYTNLVKRKKNATEYVTTSFDGFDYFGNAGSTQDPDGTFTCWTWDANRNYVSQSREAMTGASCATTDQADLVTLFVRDSSLRLVKTTNPRGDCEFREYDSVGRLSSTKPRDDCIATNAGSTRTETYTANGQVEKTEFLDASGTVKKRMKALFFDGLQISGWENPVSPSYARTFSYFADGAQERVTFENGIGKTESVRDAQNRETTHKRFTSSSTSLDWLFTYPAAGETSTRTHQTVADPVSKNVTTYIDDMGRRTRLNSPDSGTTKYSFDAASRLTSRAEAFGTAEAVTHTFLYDDLGRKVSEDYGSEACAGGNPLDVEYIYDALPAGVSCPTGGLDCTRLGGRLAMVVTFLMCTSGNSAIYQTTYYGYDNAGRLIYEHIEDSTGRIATQRYSWDPNSNLIDARAPSGSKMVSRYGYATSSNSDANLVTNVLRGHDTQLQTLLLQGIQWAPFGPVTQYTMQHTLSGAKIDATLSWNLAYRASQIKYATSGTTKTTIDYAEDPKGRYTNKDYSNVHWGVYDDYFSYDWLDRITCDAPSSGTCPTSGVMYTNVALYNTSNDRESFRHSGPGFGDHLYGVNYLTGTDKISAIESGTAGTTLMTWSLRGARTSDDNSNSVFDRREYTYDGRQRVRTISGKFFQSGSSRDYRITYAYDHRDRLVFRSFANLTTGEETHQFYYYDLYDRLIELRLVHDLSTPSNAIAYNYYWLGERPVALWQTAIATGSSARYFLHADESNRIVEVYSWPLSGDTQLVWAINGDAFGWDNIAHFGTSQFLRQNNALAEDDALSYKDSQSTYNRPGLLIKGGRHYDPMTGTLLQRSGEWPREPYVVDGVVPGQISTVAETGDWTTWNGPASFACGTVTASCNSFACGTQCGCTNLPPRLVIARWDQQGGGLETGRCSFCLEPCMRTLNNLLLRCQLIHNSDVIDGSITYPCFFHAWTVFSICFADCTRRCSGSGLTRMRRRRRKRNHRRTLRCCRRRLLIGVAIALTACKGDSSSTLTTSTDDDHVALDKFLSSIDVKLNESQQEVILMLCAEYRNEFETGSTRAELAKQVDRLRRVANEAYSAERLFILSLQFSVNTGRCFPGEPTTQ